VSFNRPYGKYCQILDAPLSIGSGEFFLWEFPLCFWLEQHGYDITYISNLDTHNDPANLLRAKGILSVGHDEYYSLEMFSNMKAAIAAGVNVAFLSGNTCCGRIEFSPGNRSFTRADRYGPRDPEEIKAFPAMALLPWKSPNENTLIGARSTGPITGGADWVCMLPDHWLYEGTGMKKGDGIAGLIGWEWHGDPASIPGLEIIASAQTRSGNKIQGTTRPRFIRGQRRILFLTHRAAGLPMVCRPRRVTCIRRLTRRRAGPMRGRNESLQIC